MRTLLVIAALFLSTGLFAQNVVTADNVDITINGQTTREQLWQIRNDLVALGLDFQYQPQFDNQRRLVSIEYSVGVIGATEPLGKATSVNNLQQPGTSTRFRLNKVNGQFAAQCFGTCEN